MSNKIIILASDTLHRRYFIKKIISAGLPVEKIIFETHPVQPPFEIGPFYSEEEMNFERHNFFLEFNDSLDDLPVHYVKNINDDESKALIKNSESELAVVFGTRKINQNIVSLFGDGLMNVHRGITQAYRGLDTNLWAIYHNDFSNIGVTVHDVNDRLDTGHIIKQKVLDIPLDTKIYQLRYYETLLATELTLEALNDYVTEQLQFYPPPDIGRYYSFMPLVIKQTLPSKLERYLSQPCSVN
jgi:hypothetical protein